MIDYQDLLLSEYGWTRNYVLWVLPFSAGIKLITSIIARLTGRDTLEERLNERKMRALAELQTQYAKN